MSYNVHIVPDAINSGMRPTLAADIMAVTGAMFVISRVVLGMLADRHGTKPVLSSALLWQRPLSFSLP
jgi:MFS family permease